MLKISYRLFVELGVPYRVCVTMHYKFVHLTKKEQMPNECKKG